MAIESPPISDVMTDDNGLARISWILFFNSLFEGDGGTSWTPTFISLGSTGSPTFSARYYRLNQRFCVFFVTITPATDTSSTAGTTAITNFPLPFAQDSVCFATSGTGAVQAVGGVRANDNRIYPPGWSSVAVPLTIVGFGVVR